MAGTRGGCLPDWCRSKVFWDLYRFGPCRFVLFCFSCWTTSGTVDGPGPRRKRGSEQFRSGSGSGRGLMVDAMLDPVSQQPYRVFLSRRQGQPSLLDSSRLTPPQPVSGISRGDGQNQVERGGGRYPTATTCLSLDLVGTSGWLGPLSTRNLAHDAIHHVPPRGRSCPRGPSNSTRNTTRLEDGTAKPLPAATNMAWAIHDDGTGAGTVCDGRRPFVEQSVFFDAPNAVARTRETAPWGEWLSRTSARPGRGQDWSEMMRRGITPDVSPALTMPAGHLLNRAGSQFEKARLGPSSTELAVPSMERIRQALRLYCTKQRQHSALGASTSQDAKEFCFRTQETVYCRRGMSSATYPPTAT